MKKKFLTFCHDNKWFLLSSLFLYPILLFIIHLLLGLIVDFVSNGLTLKNNVSIWLKTAVTLTKVWPVVVVTLFFYVLVFTKWFKHKTIKPHTKEVTSNDFGHAKWITNDQWQKLFPTVIFNQLHKTSGFIVASKKNNENTIVNIANNSHMLIIGGTGSGKTQRLVIPTIQTNAFSTIKPTMIITDPKGELFQSQSQLLQTQGYDVKVLNLRDASNSISWNLLAVIYEKWLQTRTLMLTKQEATNINLIAEQKITCYSHKQYPCQECLTKVKTYYWICKKQWFFNNKQCDKFLQQQQLILHSEMRNDLKDLTLSLFPDKVSENNQGFWTKNARKLFKAIALAILEDVEQQLVLAEVLTCEEEIALINNYLPSTKFNCATITHIMAQQDDMITWLKAHPAQKGAKIAANTILTSSGGQLSGIMATTTTELELFEEPLIKAIICRNDLDFKEITKVPTAIFIIVPDERTEHHFFVSLFISQCYKSLVNAASLNDNGQLARPVYFLLDEFANLPAITNFESMITVARSRNIFFQLVIQDFMQLEAKYNKAVANIIFANCATHLFLQTMNLETAKKYSEMIGQQTILKVSVAGKGNKQSPSHNLDHKSLISASELMQLGPQQAIVIISQQLPAKVQLLPWYQVEPHYHGQATILSSLQLVDFQEHFYYDFRQSYYFPHEQNSTRINPNKSSKGNDITMEIKNLKALLKEYNKKHNLNTLEQEMKQTLINKIQELETFQKQKEANNNEPVSND